MKDTRKLNSALNEVDERFIEEATQAGRAEHSAPGWVKYGLIPAGCAAAVLTVCILAAGNGSRGVDLIAQSEGAAFSGAELAAPGKDEVTTAYYGCGAASLHLNTSDGTFTFYPAEMFNSTPVGTFTVNERYISLIFTQLEDVKYRGRLSADGSEITILNPDELMYCWVYYTDSNGVSAAADENGGYPDIIFKYEDGAVLSAGSDETSGAETEGSSAHEKTLTYRDLSPEENNDMIKRLVGVDDTEKSITDKISEINQQIEDMKAEQDKLNELGSGTEDVEELSEQISSKQQEAEKLENDLADHREQRRNRIKDALLRGDGPLSMDGVIVTAYSGYDEWTGGNHYGIDMTSPDMTEDTVVSAFMDGTVIKAAEEGFNGGLGNYIVLDHGSGVSTVYAHLSSITVSEGQAVSAGDVIGHTGSTGYSTGLQLHFEIRENGEISSLMNSIPISQRFGWVVGGDGGLISELMDGHGGYYGHKGIDIAAERGTPVLAADDGRVIRAEWYNGYGRCVMIDHGDHVTLYGHLDDISVSEGQEVSRGGTIGTVGSAGQAASPNLHFEVLEPGTDDMVNVDPLKFLPYHERAFELQSAESQNESSGTED